MLDPVAPDVSSAAVTPLTRHSRRPMPPPRSVISASTEISLLAVDALKARPGNVTRTSGAYRLRSPSQDRGWPRHVSFGAQSVFPRAGANVLGTL